MGTVLLSSFFPWFHQGKAASMMAWRSCVSCPVPSCGPCFRFASMFIVHCSFVPGQAGWRRRFSSNPSPRLPRVLTPLNLPPCCPLSHSLRSFSPIPSRSSSRRASRRPSRSHAVSPHRLVLISSRPVVPDVPHACRPSCRRAVLFSSSRRSPHALPPLPLSSLHDRITQGGQRIPPHAPGADKHGANEQHAHRNDTDSTPPPQERLITYPQGDKTNEKNETGKQDATDETIRRDGGTAMPAGDANEKNETNKQDETIERDEKRDAPRDEQEQQESNEMAG